MLLDIKRKPVHISRNAHPVADWLDSLIRWDLRVLQVLRDLIPDAKDPTDDSYENEKVVLVAVLNHARELVETQVTSAEYPSSLSPGPFIEAYSGIPEAESLAQFHPAIWTAYRGMVEEVIAALPYEKCNCDLHDTAYIKRCIVKINNALAIAEFTSLRLGTNDEFRKTLRSIERGVLDAYNRLSDSSPQPSSPAT